MSATIACSSYRYRNSDSLAQSDRLVPDRQIKCKCARSSASAPQPHSRPSGAEEDHGVPYEGV
eukprot:scaffold125656_cov39-Tisochrysis_lutea.AAC.1